MAIPLVDCTSGARLRLKPAMGSPYNGCGWCCAMEPCALAREFIPYQPEEGPYRDLEYDAGRFVCGMIRRPGRYLRLAHDWADAHLGGIFADVLRAGEGCNADDPAPSETD